MERVEISPGAPGEGEVGERDVVEPEVYVNPSGNSSIVVLEEHDHSIQERPIPAKGPPPPPPPSSTFPSSQSNSNRNREERSNRTGSCEMLIGDDLLQFVDLQELANPERMPAKKAPVQQVKRLFDTFETTKCVS